MSQTETKKAHGYSADKETLVKRLHRIEGQVRGIEKMVEDDRYCIDILTQISAVNTALESLAYRILDQHVTHCVAGAFASGDEADAAVKTQELLEAVQRFADAPGQVDGPIGLGKVAGHAGGVGPAGRGAYL